MECKADELEVVVPLRLGVAVGNTELGDELASIEDDVLRTTEGREADPC